MDTAFYLQLSEHVLLLYYLEMIEMNMKYYKQAGLALVLIVTVNRTNGTRMLGLEASLLACCEVRILSSLSWFIQGAYIPN